MCDFVCDHISVSYGFLILFEGEKRAKNRRKEGEKRAAEFRIFPAANIIVDCGDMQRFEEENGG